MILWVSVRPAALLDVLDFVYAAALDEARWPDALRALNQAFDGSGVTLEVHAGKGSLVFFEHVELPAHGIEQYGAHYHSVCPRLPFLQALRADEAACDALHISEAEMDRSEFYADFLAPDGLRYYIGGTLFSRGSDYGIVFHPTLAAARARQRRRAPSDVAATPASAQCRSDQS